MSRWAKSDDQSGPNQTSELTSAYKEFTALNLPASEIERKFTGHLATFEEKLKAKWPNYHDFPKPAQLGLLDMIYNLGSLDGFPTFSKAVDAQDWTKAAAEYKRNGPSETRNRETKELFEKAAELAKNPYNAGGFGVLVKDIGKVYEMMWRWW